MQKPSAAPSPAQLREQSDPSERSQPIPLIAAAVTAGMVLFGAAYILLSDPFGYSSLGDRRTLADLRGLAPGAVADGKQVYMGNCVACHQANGQGLPGVFPPLAGSEWVQGDERVLANILLHGVSGPITVAGVSFQGSMPSFQQLGDAELAAVASYVRANWSNQAKPLTAERFAAERKASTRKSPFQGEAELKALARTP